MFGDAMRRENDTPIITEELKTVFSGNLTWLMEKYEVSQQDLSNHLNINRATVSQWLNTKQLPTVEALQLLSDDFGVSTDWLLSSRNEQIPQSILTYTRIFLTT